MTQPGPDQAELTQTLTLPQALDLAKQLHRAGRHEEAGPLYARLVEAEPSYADALHYYGVFQHHTGNTEAGVDLIRRALALQPQDADAYNNLGTVLHQARRFAEAADSYASVLALQPDHVHALNNRGMSLQSLKRFEEAEAAFRRSIDLAPAYSNPRENLISLLITDGRTAEAAETIRGWLAVEPGNATARHLLAAVSRENVPDRANSGYVESTFDRFAESFDRKLAKLDYRAPELVTDAVQRALGNPAGVLAVLDAGCGTGLCGPRLAPFAGRLAGVDLSGEMLARARNRDVYTELEKAELTEYLRAHPGEFDLVVSADTLCYFGRLHAVLDAARIALRPGGTLVFTVEEEAGPEPVQLNLHGRYSHARRYVEEVLAATGFVGCDIRQDVLRLEQGDGVRGLVVTAARATAQP